MNGLTWDTTTHTASTEDWSQESKNMIISAYSERVPQAEPQSFTKADFEHDLQKVSRKRETFFGENIRDAIKTIKS